MELKDFVLYIRVFKSTLMEAVLSLTASPNEKSMLRSVKPQKMEAAAGACEIHAPPDCSATAARGQRVTARRQAVWTAVSSADIAVLFPARFWSLATIVRSDASYFWSGSVLNSMVKGIYAIFMLLVNFSLQFRFVNLFCYNVITVCVWLFVRSKHCQPNARVFIGPPVLALIAKKGNFLSALKASKNKAIWIVDSGASDHMTDCHQLFSTYIPCAGNLKVKIADGSLASIAGKGSIKISDHITLESVLHVPKLACNLL